MILPIISVVIPAYNEEARIGQCLESLSATKYPDLDIIVVDDNSKDGTADVAARYSVRIVRRSIRGGIAAARNEGIKVARGEITAFVDADCVVDVDWLRLLASRFTEDNIAGVGGVIKPGHPGVIATYRSFKEREEYSNADGPVETSYLPGANCSFRTNILREVGGFDPAFAQPRGHEAFELGRRIIKRGYRLIGEPKAIIWHTSENSLKAWIRTAFGSGYSSLSFLRRLDMTEYRSVQAKQIALIAFLTLLLLTLVRIIPAIFFLALLAFVLLFEAGSALYLVFNAMTHFRNLKYLIMFPLEIMLRFCLYAGFTVALLVGGYNSTMYLRHLLAGKAGASRLG